jgi:hypothetical protein
MKDLEKKWATMMLPEIPKMPEPKYDLSKAVLRSDDPARRVFDTLVETIKSFESSLDNQHEVGVNIVSFGSSFILHVHSVNRLSEDIITFYGIDEDGQQAQLIQHVSQLSVLLIKVKKQQEQPQRISFQS